MALLFTQCDVMCRKWTYNRFNVQLFSFLVPLLKEFCGNKLSYLQRQAEKSVRWETNRTSALGRNLHLHTNNTSSSLLWSFSYSMEIPAFVSLCAALFFHWFTVLLWVHTVYTNSSTLPAQMHHLTQHHTLHSQYRCFTKIHTVLLQHINRFRLYLEVPFFCSTTKFSNVNTILTFSLPQN